MDTGRPHPQLNNAISNFVRLLMQMGLSQEEAVAQVNELGRKYGLQLGGR